MTEPTDPRTNQLFRIDGNGFVVETVTEIPTEQPVEPPPPEKTEVNNG